MRISRSGSSAQHETPVKKLSTGTVRLLLGPASVTYAPRAMRIGGRSADGIALTRFPPMVPRLRIWLLASLCAASESDRKRSCTTAELQISLCVARAPMASPRSASQRIRRRLCRFFSDTRAEGARSPLFIFTRMSVPPARTLADGPSCMRRPVASVRLSGA